MCKIANTVAFSCTKPYVALVCYTKNFKFFEIKMYKSCFVTVKTNLTV